jgi:hypothetical protein
MNIIFLLLFLLVLRKPFCRKKRKLSLIIKKTVLMKNIYIFLYNFIHYLAYKHLFLLWNYLYSVETTSNLASLD